MDEKAKYGYSENDFLGFFSCILREKHIEDELDYILLFGHRDVFSWQFVFVGFHDYRCRLQ